MYAKYRRVGARTCPERGPHSPIHESTSALPNPADEQNKHRAMRVINKSGEFNESAVPSAFKSQYHSALHCTKCGFIGTDYLCYPFNEI